MSEFRSAFAETIFRNKYAMFPDETWHQRARTIVEYVCGTAGGKERAILDKDTMDQLVQYITEFKFLPGGRYIYYTGREARFYNNCYLLRCEEDTREEWAAVAQRATSCLMTGGGIGIDYSILRPAGEQLRRTGGVSSGPIPLMRIINEIGRNVMQGGSRRSAIYASLNWKHPDAAAFLKEKNWPEEVRILKEKDFNFPANLDMTNISLNYDDNFLAALQQGVLPQTYLTNVRQALKTAEPGLSFNFGSRQNETLRNACCEVTSEDDSDVCNLGSINMGRIDSIEEFRDVVEAASKFLVCGTLRADLPYGKVHKVREKNRRLGLGLMGIHEWLLNRSKKYEVDDELHKWLGTYRDTSVSSANAHCDRLYLSRPKGYRAIAPTGTIGILASTTTGIEPLYAVAYKRRFLTEGTNWKYQYVVDSTAEHLIERTGVNPDDIETALSLAATPEKRIAFQADIQDYVDMAISSTINLPAWGSELNNEDRVHDFATTLSKYAHRLRGFTCYPDGARGGQPITTIDYATAMKHKGTEFVEHDVCDITGHGGSCGI